MCRVFTEILLYGILPVLSQHISRASELGLFETQNCLRCLQDAPEMLALLNTPSSSFEALFGILPMCTGQNFFETFCTSVIESILLGTLVWIMSNVYVLLRGFWE